MRTLAVLIALCCPLSAWTGAQRITIDHTQVPSTQTNFPMKFSCTCSYLKTVANGGSVTNSSGYDIVFASNTGGTLLNWEVESYSATTGDLIAYVRIPSLSSSADTVIYLLYGNSGITTFQSPGVPWDSNYASVFHNVTENAADSTGHTSFDSGVSSSGVGGSAYIGNGLLFNGSTIKESFSYSGFQGLSIAGSYTSSMWVRRTGTNSGNTVVQGFRTTGEFYPGIFFTNDKIEAIGGTTGGGDLAQWSTTPTLNTWYYVVGRYTPSGVELLVDGSSVASTAWSNMVGSPTNNQGKITYGATDFGSFNCCNATVDVDEMRFSLVSRSNDWITAEYNNMKPSSTFYSMASTPVDPANRTGGIMKYNGVH